MASVPAIAGAPATANTVNGQPITGYTSSAAGLNVPTVAPTPTPAPTVTPPASPQGVQTPYNFVPVVNGVLQGDQTQNAPPVEPSVLSSSNIDDTNTANTTALANKSATPTGQNLGPEGFVRNADQSFAEAPSGATAVTDPSTGNQYWSYNGMNYALGNSAGQVSSDPTVQGLYDQFTTLKGQVDATAAANIAAIQQQYAQLIQQQSAANSGNQANTYSLLARGGSLQTASSGGIVNAQVSYGLQQISDLQNKENSAVIAAQTAQQNQDYQLLDEQLKIASDANTAKQAAAQKISDAITTATAQARIDSAITGVVQSGVTDPATILSTLQQQGNTTVTLDDITKTLADLNPDQKTIYSLMQTAESNGAPQSVIQSIGNARNFTDALSAAGLYGSTATGDLQLYQNYVTQAKAAGQTPVPFESWQSTNEYNKAFATAEGTAAGKASGEGSGDGGLTQSLITSKADIPQALKPYVKQSSDGTWYMDLSSASASQKDALIAEAGDLPVITDKNQSADLANIRDVGSKLKTVATIMGDLDQPDALSRDLGGAGLTAFASMAQTNPKAAAAGALNDIALDVLKSISGVQGFRGNATAVQQVKDSLPSITDTQDTAAQKLSIVGQLISDRETGILGENGPNDTTDFVVRSEQQAQNALLSFARKDSDLASQIQDTLKTTNPDTGQPYTYLETAQIYGITIPALAAQTSIFQGGTELPNFWREIGVTQ